MDGEDDEDGGDAVRMATIDGRDCAVGQRRWRGCAEDGTRSGAGGQRRHGGEVMTAGRKRTTRMARAVRAQV
jgi:hypothetical protein